MVDIFERHGRELAESLVGLQSLYERLSTCEARVEALGGSDARRSPQGSPTGAASVSEAATLRERLDQLEAQLGVLSSGGASPTSPLVARSATATSGSWVGRHGSPLNHHRHTSGATVAERLAQMEGKLATSTEAHTEELSAVREGLDQLLRQFAEQAAEMEAVRAQLAGGTPAEPFGTFGGEDGDMMLRDRVDGLEWTLNQSFENHSRQLETLQDNAAEHQRQLEVVTGIHEEHKARLDELDLRSSARSLGRDGVPRLSAPAAQTRMHDSADGFTRENPVPSDQRSREDASSSRGGSRILSAEAAAAPGPSSGGRPRTLLGQRQGKLPGEYASIGDSKLESSIGPPQETQAMLTIHERMLYLEGLVGDSASRRSQVDRTKLMEPLSSGSGGPRLRSGQGTSEARPASMIERLDRLEDSIACWHCDNASTFATSSEAGGGTLLADVAPMAPAAGLVSRGSLALHARSLGARMPGMPEGRSERSGTPKRSSMPLQQRWQGLASGIGPSTCGDSGVQEFPGHRRV